MIRATVHQPLQGVTPYDLRTAQDNLNRALVAVQDGPLADLSAQIDARGPFVTLVANAPSTSASAGDVGDWFLSTSFLYLCLDPGPAGGNPVWRRIALASF